ncbi:hypothetical protein [Brevibacterium paucivorans]|uniref:Uncharacterized protein n=1 Tax=Brevibacterium paucivorans TaxID=170994 RepID=A0A2N6VPZ5_9MICO|nr:hypothetical protein [Brevibacterium paucivorans]PMD06214.1 hypothetical protein CJ199_02240 [Brevibacterium paucivorans]
MKFLKAFAVWLGIIPLAILNGGFRENVLVDAIGDAARPVSGIILSILILGMAFIFIPKIRDCKPADYVIMGIGWFVLTNVFDAVPMFLEGATIGQFLATFDVRNGDFWILVVLTSLVAPILAGQLRRKDRLSK